MPLLKIGVTLLAFHSYVDIPVLIVQQIFQLVKVQSQWQLSSVIYSEYYLNLSISSHLFRSAVGKQHQPAELGVRKIYQLV